MCFMKALQWKTQVEQYVFNFEKDQKLKNDLLYHFRLSFILCFCIIGTSQNQKQDRVMDFSCFFFFFVCQVLNNVSFEK